MKHVNVLGEKYRIVERNYLEDPRLIEYAGYCDKTSRTIVISERCPPSALDVENAENSKRETIRHELAHAFFFESGMTDWGNDERLVDWIAIQFPKMLEAMKAAGGLAEQKG